MQCCSKVKEIMTVGNNLRPLHNTPISNTNFDLGPCSHDSSFTIKSIIQGRGSSA